MHFDLRAYLSGSCRVDHPLALERHPPIVPVALPDLGLPTGTIIHTARGGVPIERVVAGDRVLHPTGTDRVAAVHLVPASETVLVHHQFGVIQCAPDQPLAAFAALHRWDPIPAAALRPGTLLVFDPGGYDGVATQLPPATTQPRTPHNTTGWRLRVPALDPDIAWLLGLIHGNGYVGLPRPGALRPNAYLEIALPTAYPELIARAERIVRRFGVAPRTRAGDGACVKVGAYATELALYLHQHIKQANRVIRVPDWIVRGERDVRAGYLAGVFDSDGSSRTRPLMLACSIHRAFIDDLRGLYASLGIAAEAKCQRRADGPWQALYHLSTRGVENRAWFDRVVAPRAGKYADDRATGRSTGGFRFPVELVRRELRGGWITSPLVTTDRLTRWGGVAFAAYPVRVEAVERFRRRVALVALELERGGTYTAEGFVVGGEPRAAFIRGRASAAHAEPEAA